MNKTSQTSSTKRSFRAGVLGLLACLLAAQTSLQGDGISTSSPFMPVGAPPGQPGAGPATYEISGITAIGSITHVCVADMVNKKSRWIAVGSTVDNVEVVSCDVEANRVVIRVGPETKTLFLRKPATQKMALAAPGPMPAQNLQNGPQNASSNIPPGPVDPKLIRPPETREEKEREARMLVSDLLDIGMRQRKAYEEARKAEDAKRKEAPQPVDTSTQSKK